MFQIWLTAIMNNFQSNVESDDEENSVGIDSSTVERVIFVVFQGVIINCRIDTLDQVELLRSFPMYILTALVQVTPELPQGKLVAITLKWSIDEIVLTKTYEQLPW